MSDIYRTILANSRMPADRGRGPERRDRRRADRGAGVQAGRRAPRLRAVPRVDPRACTTTGRPWSAATSRRSRTAATRPRGCWTATGRTTCRSSTKWTVVIEGSTIRLDYTNAPVEQPGPVNCTLPDTVSASRIAVMALAGGGEQPCEGHFRPLEVVDGAGDDVPRPAAGAVLPVRVPHGPRDRGRVPRARAGDAGAVPAGSGGDLCAFIQWGNREGRRAVGGLLAMNPDRSWGRTWTVTARTA